MQGLLAELTQLQAPALVVGALVTRAPTKAALGSSPGASGEAGGQAPGPRHVRGPQLPLASSPLGLGAFVGDRRDKAPAGRGRCSSDPGLRNRCVFAVHLCNGAAGGEGGLCYG